MQTHVGVVIVALLVLVAPAHAETEGAQAEQAKDERNEDANKTQETRDRPEAGDSSGCNFFEWWGTQRPTYIVIDPDRCYIPSHIRDMVGTGF